MQVSPQTQAVLLLTAHFSKARPEDVKPLTPTEWGRFALWLKDEDKGPEVLLRGDLRDTLSKWTDRQVTEDRVTRLLDRGSALAFAMEKWQRSGLWVLARSDSAYPKNLKIRLKTASPPILFGCGNANILNQKGIAVVGSRNASHRDLDYASKLGASAANAGFSIVSGGAKGIDEAAMLGALQADGTAVGILADSLLRASSSQKYREHLSNKNLVLVSSYYPEAGFNAGNAMGRNKYIYCLADAAVVVHSGRKGGTWNGALETLKKGWIPVWVKPTQDDSAGNAEIVQQGATWAPEDVASIDVPSLIDAGQLSPQPRDAADLFETAVHEPAAAYTHVKNSAPSCTRDERNRMAPTVATEGDEISDLGFYELFLLKLEKACKNEAISPDELADRLGLKTTQLNEWLKQAVSEKKVKKLNRPVRYRWQDGDAQQTMF